MNSSDQKLTLFLDFDGVLHKLFEINEETGYATPYPGPYFLHAPWLAAALRPWLSNLDIVVSSTWGRKRSLEGLCDLLPDALAARVVDAVHHHLPLPRFSTDGINSRWAEIAYYREHVRSGIGGHWLALDDDDRLWPADQRSHLVHCREDLGSVDSQDAIVAALTRMI